MSTNLRLNLIPNEHKAELRRRRLGKFVLRTCYFFIFFSFAVALLLLGLRYTLQKRFAQIIAETAVATKDNLVIESKVGSLNQMLVNATEIVGAAHPWGQFIRLFVTTIPSNIQISHIDLHADDASSIDGIAQNRDALIAFKNNLLKAPYIKSVDVPLNDLLARTNAHFTIRFQIDFTKLPH